MGDSAVTGTAAVLDGEPVPSRPKTTVRRLTLRVWDEQAQCERLQGIGFRWECASCDARGTVLDAYRDAAYGRRAHRCEPRAAAG